MKALTRQILLGTIVFSAVAPRTCPAFHEKGTGSCMSCHVLHPSRDGTVVIIGGEPLLVAATATDVCLRCHGGENGVLGANPLAPPPERGAGNFVYLLEDNLNDGPNGQIRPIHGSAAGHSIVSREWGLQADPDRLYAPGGDFPSSQLGCTSCHDPHGNGSFRMLNGVGPIQGDSYVFQYPAPAARGLSATDPYDAETDSRHTAYFSGMSDWCANCHNRYHDEVGRGPQVHPYEALLAAGEAQTYNVYNGTADPLGGVASNAYVAAVPFEDAANTTTSTQGPSSVSTVMCLTCHRAHASSAPHAGRWDFGVRLLVNDGRVSGSYPIPSPYPDPEQDSLCNKCHARAMSSGP